MAPERNNKSFEVTANKDRVDDKNEANIGGKLAVKPTTHRHCLSEKQINEWIKRARDDWRWQNPVTELHKYKEFQYPPPRWQTKVTEWIDKNFIQPSGCARINEVTPYPEDNITKNVVMERSAGLLIHLGHNNALKIRVKIKGRTIDE